jgi:uncharacterized protein (DUF58 family)
MNTSQRVTIILLALSVIAGVTTGEKIYYRLSYLWGFLLVGSWIWSHFSIRGLKLKRSARALRAQVGQIFEERFDILNQTWLPRLWLEVNDESNLPGSEGSRVLSMIDGRQGRAYLAPTRLIQRGVFPLGPTVLASGDIFGIFPASIRIPAQDTLLVYPMMVDVQLFPNPPGLLPGGEALRRRTHQVTPNAAGVREYSHGDPLNRIHWLSTARRDRLMVKEFELDPLADVWIFLDASQSVQYAQPRTPIDFKVQDLWQRNVKIDLPPSTEEYGVSVAASLVRDYLRRGRSVGLVSSGSFLTLIPPDRGGRQLGKILEALAIVRAEGEIPLRGLVEMQVKHMVKGSSVILISPSTQREMVIVAEYLLRRGLLPIVVLIDASSFGGSEESDDLVIQIRSMGIPVRLIKNGVALEASLADDLQQMTGAARSMPAGKS